MKARLGTLIVMLALVGLAVVDAIETAIARIENQRRLRWIREVLTGATKPPPCLVCGRRPCGAWLHS